jgi:hypothetical protein
MHAPPASQRSAASSSQRPPFAAPVHGVSAAAIGCVQTPPAQTSSVQAMPSEVQLVPSTSLFSRQLPVELQVFGASQSVSLWSPQAVFTASNPPLWSHAPEPLHSAALQSSGVVSVHGVVSDL